jgi:hypothetical protein
MITKPKIIFTHNKWRSHFDILAFFEKNGSFSWAHKLQKQMMKG